MRTILIVFLLTFTLNSFAQNINISNQLRQYSGLASQKTEIPEWLILSIAYFESSFYQYAVNVQGKSFYCESLDCAINAIKKAEKENKTYDVGYMQINKYWLDKYKINPEVAFEPKINFLLGAYILKYEITRNGNKWLSVGYYHSKNHLRAKQYAQKIFEYSKYVKNYLEKNL
jgi:soluble lytic murein transglycosylase-like protein